jgi:hypothetical protein
VEKGAINLFASRKTRCSVSAGLVSACADIVLGGLLFDMVFR